MCLIKTTVALRWVKNLNENMRKWEIVILLAIATVFESVAINYIPSASYLDLPLVFALCIGWHSTPVRGIVCGTILGWFQDAVFGMFLGLNGSSKALIGFVGAHLNKWLVLEHSFARFLMIGALSLLDSGVVTGIAVILNQPLLPGFWIQALIKIPVTGVIGVIVFRFYHRIKFPRKDFRRLKESGFPL